jgi:hypothetical protein
MVLDQSSGNAVYGNDFLGPATSAYDDGNGNLWSVNGVGNYWANGGGSTSYRVAPNGTVRRVPTLTSSRNHGSSGSERRRVQASFPLLFPARSGPRRSHTAPRQSPQRCPSRDRRPRTLRHYLHRPLPRTLWPFPWVEQSFFPVTLSSFIGHV